MEKILDKINEPKDLEKLNIKEKEELAKEIREYILEIVSENGGHLASNLGIVELTIALHSVFNVPKDKIIWDVGHQTYVHKILTGRREKMKTLRKLNGIAGFPKLSESETDCFGTGHSGTSISVALGMARARDILKEKENIIAVIGDGSITGGMALEALNDAGCSKTNITVILNDNEMSISKNVGGISMSLSKIRTRKFYTKSNNFIKKSFKQIPIVGPKITYFARKIKYSLKQLFLSNMIFEDMGFTYLGPVDGHDIDKLKNLLKISKKIEGPVLIHVLTKKGKGYKPAEEEPHKFHGVSAFEIETGKLKKKKQDDYSKIFGKKLISLAKKNEKIVAITAAMKTGTGLTEFANKYPNRFFDVAIAEQHAIGLAAGLASQGLKPVVSIYSSFYQRAFDQVIHDVAIQNLPVIMCVDRAGIVGADGETHQGILDLSFFNIIPNIEIVAPKDFKELEQMLEYAVNINKPIVIRYPRGGEGNLKFEKHADIEEGKAEIIKEGRDVTIIAIGKMVEKAAYVEKELEKEGILAEVINARFLKPLDKKTILKSLEKTKKVITIEDNILQGGLSTLVKELIIDNYIQDVKIKSYGYPDEFIKQGTVDEIEKKYGLDVDTIVEETRNMFKNIN